MRGIERAEPILWVVSGVTEDHRIKRRDKRGASRKKLVVCLVQPAVVPFGLRGVICKIRWLLELRPDEIQRKGKLTICRPVFVKHLSNFFGL